MKCPECDLDLGDRDVYAHLIYHYPERPPRENAEARKRYATLEREAVKQQRARPLPAEDDD